MGRRKHAYMQVTIPSLQGDFEYISDEQRSHLWRTARQNGWEADDLRAEIADVQHVSFDSASVKTLLQANFAAVLERLAVPASKPLTGEQLKLSRTPTKV